MLYVLTDWKWVDVDVDVDVPAFPSMLGENGSEPHSALLAVSHSLDTNKILPIQQANK